MNIVKLKSSASTVFMAVLFVAFFAMPSLVFAQTTDTQDQVCSFVNNINSILKYAAVAVVTIAIIFCGYQIAFAHKRISDVAPILIGALLIGAAAYIAKMIIGDGNNCLDDSSVLVIKTILLNHA